MKFGSGMLRGAYLSAGIRLTGNLIRRKESTYPTYPTVERFSRWKLIIINLLHSRGLSRSNQQLQTGCSFLRLIYNNFTRIKLLYFNILCIFMDKIKFIEY